MESTLSWNSNPLQIHRCFPLQPFLILCLPSGLEKGFTCTFSKHTPYLLTLFLYISSCLFMSPYSAYGTLLLGIGSYLPLQTVVNWLKKKATAIPPVPGCAALCLYVESRAEDFDAVSVGHERNRGLKEGCQGAWLSNMKKRTFIYTGEEDRGRTDLGRAIKQAVVKPSWIPNLFFLKNNIKSVKLRFP